MILKFYNKFKSWYKLRKFKKLSTIGNGLVVYPRSGCYADKAGLISIGDRCDIAGILYSMGDGKITIGNHTEIRENSFIGSVEEIKIGDCVIISNNVKIYDNNNHPTDPEIRKEMCLNGFYGDAWRWEHSASAPVIIDDNVWIGERSAILKGVHIGEGSIVGCNSVVTKDVPPYSIVAGNPARVVKMLRNEKN